MPEQIILLIMRKNQLFLLFILLILTVSATAQTIIKIPFQQPEQFVVHPKNIHKSLEGLERLEIGAELEIFGGSGIYTFSWTFEGTIIGSDPTVLIYQKGVYTLTINDGVSCEAQINYFIDMGTVVNDPRQYHVLIYPNPAQLNIYITAKGLYNFTQIDIYSLDGILRSSIPIDNCSLNDFSIDVSVLPVGNYLLILQSEVERITRILLIR